VNKMKIYLPSFGARCVSGLFYAPLRPEETSLVGETPVISNLRLTT
jgi:hypothetical protein